jgi:hypothetical protein
MALYFEKYSLKEKLFEYAELNARKKALETDLLNYINKNTTQEFNKLKTGNIDNIIEIGHVVDKILKIIEKGEKTIC